MYVLVWTACGQQLQLVVCLEMRRHKGDDTCQVMQPVAVVAQVQCTPKHMHADHYHTHGMECIVWLNDPSWYADTNNHLQATTSLHLPAVYNAAPNTTSNL